MKKPACILGFVQKAGISRCVLRPVSTGSDCPLRSNIAQPAFNWVFHHHPPQVALPCLGRTEAGECIPAEAQVTLLLLSVAAQAGMFQRLSRDDNAVYWVGIHELAQPEGNHPGESHCDVEIADTPRLFVLSSVALFLKSLDAQRGFEPARHIPQHSRRQSNPSSRFWRPFWPNMFRKTAHDARNHRHRTTIRLAAASSSTCP